MFILRVCAMAALVGTGEAWLSPVLAEESPAAMGGKQTAGVVVGGMFPVRLTDGQSSKLNGVAVHPSWQMTMTNPNGDEWWSGSIALGVEMALFGVAEPTGAYGVGFTPKAVAVRSGRISKGGSPSKVRISISSFGVEPGRTMI